MEQLVIRGDDGWMKNAWTNVETVVIIKGNNPRRWKIKYSTAL